MKKQLILFLSIVTFFSCSKDDNDPSELMIRLSNVSQYDFENIVVNTTTGNVSFEDLMSGQKSEYKIFNKAYSYAFVELEINEITYSLIPIDYVGETPLENGKYTYQLDLDDTDEQHPQLSLSLKIN